MAEQFKATVKDGPAFASLLASLGYVPDDAGAFDMGAEGVSYRLECAVAHGLANPYGDGNHHRINWRRSWDVDLEALTARHQGTGFVLVFAPCPEGGYTARIGCALPPFGPDGEQAMAQMFGLRQLLKDGWDIFHTVARKVSR